MTEAEWLACTNPKPMLEFLEGKVSERKLRLFACACCRKVWHLLKEPCLPVAVELAEQFADSQASVEELAVASDAAWETKYRLETVGGEAKEDDAFFFAAEAAAAASCGPGNDDVDYHFRVIDAARDVVDTGGCSRPAEAALLHCIFGPLSFQPINLDSAWLAWKDSCVVKIAQAIYDERAFDGLPILADALEEGGCTNQDILQHCRQSKEHVRGCWVVDLILGK